MRKTSNSHVVFTGELLKHLRIGDETVQSLPSLRVALVVANDKDEVISLATTVAPALKTSQHKKAGRPKLLCRIMQARGEAAEPTEILTAFYEELLFQRMEESLAASKRKKVLQAAFEVMGEREILGHVNGFYVDVSIDSKKRDMFAESIKELFAHRMGRRKQHAVAKNRVEQDVAEKVLNRLSPVLSQIISETAERVGTECAARLAAGVCAVDIDRSLPERASKIAAEIGSRYLRGIIE